MNPRWWEKPAWILCDYWYLFLIFLGLVLGGIFLLNRMNLARHTQPPIDAAVTMQSPAATMQSPTSNQIAFTATQLNQETPTSTPVVTDTPEPIASKPRYIFGMIPVNWTGSNFEFETLANKYIEFFVDRSDMGQYFDIQVQILDESSALDFNSDYILEDLVSYGVNEFPADRYIGITSGDIISGGDNSVLGFTYGDGAYSVIVEAVEIEIVAHELGHTYGLCDEYDYQAWMAQNQEFPEGCPNHLHPECDSLIDMCLGVDTENGENSIMGLAGYEGGFGFNTECFDHLQKRFKELAESVNQ